MLAEIRGMEQGSITLELQMIPRKRRIRENHVWPGCPAGR